tara:strand:+ start:178 stop:1077 length:900 start_codon:yes stop_codon:yes gene_type:complete
MRERIYIAGCGGMLGEAFYRVFSEDFDLKCTDIDTNEQWLSFNDFRDLDEYSKSVKIFNPNYLIHLGAHTDLEYCEINHDDAYLTNSISVENATFIANELNIPLLYISTAGIFDGSKDVFDDWDSPNPLGVYARSKYAGEKFVENNANRYLICRAGWMMGGGPKKDKKFVNKIIKQIKTGKKEIFIVNDKFGTPTYTIDFAMNMKLLLKKRLWGLYNLVCNGTTGRLEVAKEIIKILKLENKIKITEVSSEFFQKEYFAKRPKSERLINQKLNLRGLNHMRDWKLCLNEYISEHFKDVI